MSARLTAPATSLEEPSSKAVALAVVMICMTPLFWAGHSVVGRLVANDIPTYTLVSLRWFLAAGILFLFVYKRCWAERYLLLRHWRMVLLTGIIGPTLFPVLLYSGLKTTTVTNTSIIQCLVPALVPVFAWLMLRIPIRPMQILGIAISIVGVIVIVTKGKPLAVLDVAFVIGDLFILAGFTIWSVYTVVIRLKPPAISPNTMLVATMFIAAIATMPLGIMEAADGHYIPMTAKAWWAIGYIVVFPSLLAYLFYNNAVNIIGPTKAGLASHLVPPTGIVLGVIFLGETFAPYHAISFAAILAGVILVIRSGRASNRPIPS